MKNIAVTGSTGFIGSRFLDLFTKNYSITTLSRHEKVPDNFSSKIAHLQFNMKDGDASLESLKNFDCLVHLAFDSVELSANKTGLAKIIDECLINNIKRLIHVSTVSVYDPFHEGMLDESCSYTTLKDPYSNTKKDLEVFLKRKINNTNLEVIILQPTIVYGLGGTWTDTALSAVTEASIALPNNGDLPCNCVHVDDVAKAINAAVVAPEKADNLSSYLVSGPGHVTWHQFYDEHAKILQKSLKIKKPTYFATSFSRKYHPSRIQNIIIGLIVSPFFMGLPGLIISKLRKGKGGGQADPQLSLKDRYKQGEGVYHTTALARMATSSTFIIDTKACNDGLNFTAEITFESGMNSLAAAFENKVK